MVKKLSYVGIVWVILLVNVVGQSINDLIPKGTSYYIQSALEYQKSSKGFWDIAGGPDKIREGADIQLYDLGDRAQDRKYVIEDSPTKGYVRIHIERVAGYIDISGKNDKNGAKIHIWNANNDWNQNFSFQYKGNGRFKIYSQKGRVICANGRKSDNGNSVVVWGDHDGPWMEWVLISALDNRPLLLEDKIKGLQKDTGEDMSKVGKFYLQSALSYGKNLNGFFDIPGGRYPKNGDNLQMWQLDFGPDRLFEIKTSNSEMTYYNINIAGNPNLVFDVAGGSNADGANVAIYGKHNGVNQNFKFKHLGNGRFKIYAQNGKVVCVPRDDKNGSNVYMWTDHDGAWMEWYLIDSETNAPFIPGGIKTDVGGSNPELTDIFNDIDNTYNVVNQFSTKTGNVFQRINNSVSIFERGNNICTNVSELNSRVKDTESALQPFERLPYIGPPVRVLSKTLSISLSQIGKIEMVTNAVKEPVIDKSGGNITSSALIIMEFNSRLNFLKTQLIESKKSLLENSNNNSGTKNDYSAIKQRLQKITNSVNSIDPNLNEINSLCNKMNKISKPITDVDEGLNKFDNGYKNVDKVADEINKVLDKRFQKGIGKVKIDISIRKVLEGGKVGKIFEKYVNKFIDAALKPLINKLNIQLPGLPNVDKFKEQVTEGKDITEKIKENSQKIELIGNELR